MVRGLQRRRLAALRLGTATFGVAVLALGPLAGHAAAENVYAVDNGSNDLTAINARTGQPIGPRIPVGTAPESIAISPDGRTAYVPNRGTGEVSIVDLQTRRVVGSIPVASGLNDIEITADGALAYVATGFRQGIAVIDLKTNLVLGAPFALPFTPDAIALSRDGKTLYVTDFEADKVHVLDARTGQEIAAPMVGNGAGAVAISPDGRTALVGNFLQSTISELDTATNQVLGQPIVVDSGNPNGIVFSGDGKTAYVTHLESGTVSVVDTAKRETVAVLERQDLGFATAVAISQDSRRLYVANRHSDTVSVFDLASGSPTGTTIPVGDEPEGLAIAPFNLPPVAAIAPHDAIRVGASVEIDGSGSYDADGALTRYAWSFGDGSKAPRGNPAKPRHAFKRTGTYKVSLTVTDDQGCSLSPNPGASSCSGSALAKVTVPVKVRNPQVLVRCPRSAGPKGCGFTLQGIVSKRKPTPMTGVSKLHLKAGKSGLASLKPKPRYLAEIGRAHVVLVVDTQSMHGRARTTMRRLLLR